MILDPDAYRRWWSANTDDDGELLPHLPPVVATLAAHVMALQDRVDRLPHPDDGHRYLSTACLHDDHGYCAATVGAVGPKVPARCKFCHAPCVCPCHPHHRHDPHAGWDRRCACGYDHPGDVCGTHAHHDH